MKFKKIIFLFRKYSLYAIFLYAKRVLGLEVGGIHDVKPKKCKPIADLYLEEHLIDNVR